MSQVCDGFNDCIHGGDEFCAVDSFDKAINKSTYKKNISSKPITSNAHSVLLYKNDKNQNNPNIFHENESFHNFCKNPNYLPCNMGHDTCLPPHNLCLYEIDHSFRLMICRNGAHLYNCKLFQCSRYFKCPRYYCIPFRYVCDGKWDCPHGSDEMTCSQLICPNLFKCNNQTKCLHLTRLCNGLNDCIYGDDEKVCLSNIFSKRCPEECICFSESFFCKRLSSNILSNAYIETFPCKFFECLDCKMSWNTGLLLLIPLVKIIILKKQLLEKGCFNFDKSHYLKIYTLDLSYNAISSLQSNCFPLNFMHHLYLKHNNISVVEENAFIYQGLLKLLDLSNNQLHEINFRTFNGLLNIKVLNLSQNRIQLVFSSAFKNFPVESVHSQNEKICCIAGPWSCCVLLNDPFSSCHDLLPYTSMKYTCRFVTTFSITLNLISFIFHLSHYKKHNLNNIFLLSLSFVDFWYGIYLCGISAADFYHQDQYIGLEYHWRNSIFCKLISILAFLSLILSPIIFFNMMLNKFCVVKWPLNSKFKNIAYAKNVFLFTIIVGVLITISFICPYIVLMEKHSPTGLCLQIFTLTEASLILKLSSFTLIMIRIITIISILSMYIWLLKILFRRNKVLDLSNLKGKERAKSLSLSLLIIIGFNIVAWMPFSVVISLPLVGNIVHYDLLAWVIIMVVPINSTFDPIFLNILSPDVRKYFKGLFLYDGKDYSSKDFLLNT